jgi:uncharacterized protein YbaR (Trm112 family)
VNDYLVEMLDCPVCHGTLSWTVMARHADAVEEGEARCTECGARYPVRDGIGLFLTPDLPRNDLWDQIESGLARYFREHPDVERRLMEAPFETLNPADQLFRSMILEERGEYDQARIEAEDAMRSLYTEEYRSCYDSQVEYLVRRMSGTSGPIVDLASGRGALVERLTERLDNPIVMTDFSPAVLRRDRYMLEHRGLAGRVSLLALDARRTPFKNGSVARLTSNLGLGNLEEPGDVLAELRRVVAGELLAISQFYPADDEVHQKVLKSTELLYREATLRRFQASGWSASVENVCHGRAEPTPKGVVLNGFGIDGLPVASTVLEWSVVVAR